MNQLGQILRKLQTGFWPIHVGARVVANRHWIWVDRTSVSENVWSGGTSFGKQNCGIIKKSPTWKDGQLNQVSCDIKQKVICEKPASKY